MNTTAAVNHSKCEHRKTLSADHATNCPVYADGALNSECTCHFSDAVCEADQAAAAKEQQEQRPVVVHVDWTHREGTRITGIMLFGDLGPAEEQRLQDAGKEPQFLITGGTRRRTVDAFNDYGTEQFTADRADVASVAAQAAAWLGITAPLDIRERREYEGR